jgi:hypothetical protein
MFELVISIIDVRIKLHSMIFIRWWAHKVEKPFLDILCLCFTCWKVRPLDFKKYSTCKSYVCATTFIIYMHVIMYLYLLYYGTDAFIYLSWAELKRSTRNQGTALEVVAHLVQARKLVANLTKWLPSPEYLQH